MNPKFWRSRNAQQNQTLEEKLLMQLKYSLAVGRFTFAFAVLSSLCKLIPPQDFPQTFCLPIAEISAIYQQNKPSSPQTGAQHSSQSSASKAQTTADPTLSFKLPATKFDNH